MSRIVRPSSRARRAISVHMSARISGSSPVVGSSRKSTAGRWTRPMATSSRRCMPPEYVRASRSAASGEAEALEQVVDRGRARRRAARGCGPADEVLAPGRLAVDARSVCATTPIARRTRSGSSQHVDPGDRGLAGVGARQRRQDLDRRRFAGAVRAEQAEDGAGLDRERDAVESPHLARVALDRGRTQLIALSMSVPPGCCDVSICS